MVRRANIPPLSLPADRRTARVVAVGGGLAFKKFSLDGKRSGFPNRVSFRKNLRILSASARRHARHDHAVMEVATPFARQRVSNPTADPDRYDLVIVGGGHQRALRRVFTARRTARTRKF